jgi:hypothetical protein
LDNLNIFPGTSRIYENEWPQKWLFGRFKAQLDGYYGQQNLPLTAMAYFWVIPYRLIIAFVLALAIIIVGGSYLRHRQTVGIEIKEETLPAPSEKPEKKTRSKA